MSPEIEIEKFTRQFRKKVEQLWDPSMLWPKFRLPEGVDAKSAGYCGPTSIVLIAALKKKFPSENFSIATGKVYTSDKEFIIGKHVWVMWHVKIGKAYVIDATADQSPYFSDTVLFEDMDVLAKKQIYYQPRTLARSMNEIGVSARSRSEILMERIGGLTQGV